MVFSHKSFLLVATSDQDLRGWFSRDGLDWNDVAVTAPATGIQAPLGEIRVLPFEEGFLVAGVNDSGFWRFDR